MTTATKVTEIVGVVGGEGNFFYFETMTREERDAMWLTARETGRWPQDPDVGYVYGHASLPGVEPGQRGRWRITVEFEPEEER